MGKTNYLTLDKITKTEKKTVFNKIVTGNLEIAVVEYATPDSYLNILYLGHDNDYGDVFKCWDHDENDFAIIFGEKGNEFE